MALGCSDLFKMGITEGHCCLSCHEDYDDYNYDMCCATLINGQEIEVCCATSISLEMDEFIKDPVHSKKVLNDQKENRHAG